MKLYLAALMAMLPAVAAAPDTIKGNAVGNASAPLVLEVFSDFQCPACKKFHDEELPLLVRDYVSKGKAYLIYRYFPLPQHAYGRKAAELVCACAQFGKYEPAADVLFANQAMWSQTGKVDETVASVLTAAEQKRLPALLKDPKVLDPIDHDLAEGRALPVVYTPTLAVSYKSKHFNLYGDGLSHYDWVKAAFDELLKQ